MRSTNAGKVIHGDCRRGCEKKYTPEYCAWMNMRARCTNPKHRAFRYYGARGIAVCERWINSYDNFLKDMGRKPTSSHQLDRIDTDGDYSPENCRWVTKHEQMRNTRKTVFISAHGIRKPLREWSEEMGIDPKLVWARIRSGWDGERALST